MGLSSKKFTRGLRRNFAKAQRAVAKFGKSLKRNLGRIATRSIQIGLLAVGAGLAIATKEFIELDSALTAASAKFGPAFQRGTEGFEQLGKTARQIGAITEFSATQAAEGIDFLALAGFNAAQSMALIPGVVDLATAAQTDLATASDIASDSLGAFNLMTEDTEQLGLNFARVMDVMAKTTTTANTDLVTLFESVKKGAPSFTAAGQSLESFNALAGIMANNSLKGAESGTSLRNIMLRLSKPTGEAADVIKQLGVQTADSEGNFRDVIDIIADFEKGLKGMGTQQRTAALATVFGSRTVTGINILLAEGSDKLRDYRSQLEGATGAAGEMATVMRTSLKNQLSILKSSALELGLQFVEAFETEGRGALTNLIKTVQNFDMTPVINGARFLGEVFQKLVSFIKPVIDTIIRIGIELFEMLKETETGSKVLELIGSLFGALGVAIEIMWKIAKPILNLLLNILDPILTVIIAIVDGIATLAKFKLAGGSVAKFEQAGLQLATERRSPEEEARRTAAGESFRGRLGQAPISPSERSVLSREEIISRGEVTIRDETGRAEMTETPRGGGFNLNLVQSGEF